MQQSQKLKAIEYIFTSNKEKELSYSKNNNLIVQDKMTNDLYRVIKEKYIWFDILEWVQIYNQVWDRLNIYNIYYKLRWINFYIKSLTSESRWWNVPKWIKFKTIFRILNSKIFLNSILDFIDNEKENLIVLNEQEQVKEIKKEIEKSKVKFEMFKLPLTFNLSKYLSSYSQYYKTLKLLKNQYNIEDIQIYQWKITFTLTENKNNETLIIFENDNLFIDRTKVYFQRKTTVIFEIIKLLFLYFQDKNINYVEFDDLEKYYKVNKVNYPNLEKSRFNYEYLRKTIETKTKEIESKHNLNKTFLGIDTSWITCQYLKPENK